VVFQTVLFRVPNLDSKLHSLITFTSTFRVPGAWIMPACG
jgi:hypothetical protein